MNKFLMTIHTTQVRALILVQPFFLLLIRLYWGYQFLLAGRGKLMNLDRTSQFFESLKIPLPGLNALIAGSVECFGGLLLILGLGSRVVTIPLIFTMLVAYWTAHHAELVGVWSNSDAFVTAPPFLFLFASCIILLFGAGWISLDRILGWCWSSDSP